MTKKIRKIVLFTIVTTLLTVTGCGDKKNTDTATSNKPAIAYIVANTANSKPVLWLFVYCAGRWRTRAGINRKS